MYVPITHHRHHNLIYVLHSDTTATAEPWEKEEIEAGDQVHRFLLKFSISFADSFLSLINKLRGTAEDEQNCTDWCALTPRGA